MDEEEKWNRLMMSIRKAARILNLELTEPDMPQPSDWRYASSLNSRLWGLVTLMMKNGK